MSDNAFYLADVVTSLADEENQTKLVQRLRQYLELRNVSILIGNGCSIPHGAPPINSIASVISELDREPYRLGSTHEQRRARRTLDRLLATNQSIGVEPLLAVLSNIRATAQALGQSPRIGQNPISDNDAATLERLVKKWLYHRCRELNTVPDDRLRCHEELLRRVLLRSATLPRAKVFTTNYDLLLERALDNLGVHYFDGFLGTITRTLHTESYHYDLYYPGETTEGRVSRVDRVLHLYKLHGGINWRRRVVPGFDVQISHMTPEDVEYGDVMIYPTPLKVSEMNGYPYAEMLRHFSAHIHQPQSALFTIGYSFQDDHINRLIYQALTVPSFVLIIVTPSIATPADPQQLGPHHEIWRVIHEVKSRRVLVITGSERDEAGRYTGGAGTIQDFSTKWLPDIKELAVESQAREETRKALKPLTARQDDSELA